MTCCRYASLTKISLSIKNKPCNSLAEVAKGLPLEILLTETDTPYFHQHNNLGIGVPGLALDCPRKIAALRGDDLSMVLATVRNNVKDLYNINF